VACSPLVLGATRTFDFEGFQYGVADSLCGNKPKPPLLTRPEYSYYTRNYIVDPGACGEGAYGVSNGSDSLLTAGFPAGAGNGSNGRRYRGLPHRARAPVVSPW